MERIKIILLAAVLAWGVGAAAQTPRITITKFEHNPLSILGKTNPVKDNNGEDCAVIRFFVADRGFSIDEALQTDTLIGELRTWVPRGTKRITVRHEGMLPLVGYKMPMPIESLSTYEAIVEVVKPQTPVDWPKRPRQTFAYLGAGYNVLQVMGPSATLGISMKRHQIEVGGVYGLNKTDDLYFYSSDGKTLDAYRYYALRAQLRYGYEFTLMNERFSVIPQVGCAWNIFMGQGVTATSGGNAAYKQANCLSAIGAVRLSLSLGKTFKLYVTSEYDFAIKKNNTCEFISNYDNTMKNWCTGLNLNAGILIYL